MMTLTEWVFILLLIMGTPVLAAIIGQKQEEELRSLEEEETGPDPDPERDWGEGPGKRPGSREGSAGGPAPHREGDMKTNPGRPIPLTKVSSEKDGSQIAGILKRHGIPSKVKGTGSTAFGVGLPGNVAVLVGENHFDEAKEILEQSDEVPEEDPGAHLPDDIDPDDVEDPFADRHPPGPSEERDEGSPE